MTPPPKEQKRWFTQKDVLSDLVGFWYVKETVLLNKTEQAYVMCSGKQRHPHQGPKMSILWKPVSPIRRVSLFCAIQQPAVVYLAKIDFVSKVR